VLPVLWRKHQVNYRWQFSVSFTLSDPIVQQIWGTAPTTHSTSNNSVIKKLLFVKYLGVRLFHNLTWNKHERRRSLQSFHKAGWSNLLKILSILLLRKLLQLSMSLIQPHPEYTAPVLDPNLRTLAYAVEKVQMFALKMCLRDWSSPYRDLFDLSELPTLQWRTFFETALPMENYEWLLIFTNAPLDRSVIEKLKFSCWRLPSWINAYMHLYFPIYTSHWNNLYI